MQNLMERNEKSVSALRRFSCVMTLCALAAFVGLIGGCPPMQPGNNNNGNSNTTPPCTEDADCDDGLFCNGTESCVEGVCFEGTSPCTAEQTCDEENDVCEDPAPTCTVDADCDDGLFCNGAETCVDGACAAGTSPCTGDQTCDEVTDECVDPAPECVEDADCDDGVFCNGGETCVDGACVAGVAPCVEGEVCDEAGGVCVECLTNADCSDGLFCNGSELCAAGGVCVNGPAPCAEGEACDEATDSCVGTACDVDDDCEGDGNFCSGDPICIDGVCGFTGDPCDTDAGETCDEGLNLCIPAPVVTLDFTLQTDALLGGGGDDIFQALLIFNAPTGTNLPSLQTGDSANGGDGDDILNAQFNFTAGTTVAPTLSNIEVYNITDFGTAATTLAGGGLSGVEEINLLNSTNTNNFVFTALSSLVDLGITNQAIAANLTFNSAVTTGNADAMTIFLNNVTGSPTINITTGTTNGIETLTIDSMTNPSILADIAMNGTSLTTINVSGDAAFTHTASLDANVTTVNAAENSGGVTLTQTNAGAFTFTGGGGDDTLILGATYGSTDILNGGGGNDTLGGTTAVIGGTAANQTNVTNFEGLRVSDAHTTAITASHFGSISTVTLDAGSNAGSLTIASGATVNFGTNGASVDGAGAFSLTVSGSATTDSVTIVANDYDQTGAFTFTGAETVNLQSNINLNGAAADGGANVFGAAFTLTDTAATERLNITGTAPLTITGAVTANVVDASAFTQVFTMSTTSLPAGGITINGGSGNDVLFGSVGADIISGGAGNDTIRPLAGLDIVTGGDGADVFHISSGDTANRNTITDFNQTVTTGDRLNLDSGLATLTGTDNFATSSSIQTHSAAGALVVNAAAEVVVITSGTVANFTDAASLTGTNLLTAVGGTITGAIAGQNDILLLVANTSGDIGVYYATSANNAIIAAEISLVAILQANANLAIGGFTFGNFSNGA